MYKLIAYRWSLVLAAYALGLLVTAVVPAEGSTGSAGMRIKRVARHHAVQPAGGGTVFGAVTAGGLPAVIQVSRDGREVVEMAMAIPVRCEPDGVTVLVPTTYRSAPIGASGAFGDGFEGSDSEGSAKGTVAGKFNRSMTTVRSIWDATIVVTGPTGPETCTSGPVSVTATD
jgi:hypothetical protein